MPMEVIGRLKEAMGIKRANCGTCAQLGTDDNGGYPEYVISWKICEVDDRMVNLRSFPFKKDMSCWWPEFWHSKFADIIDGTDESENRASEEFKKAIAAACPKEGGR